MNLSRLRNSTWRTAILLALSSVPFFTNAGYAAPIMPDYATLPSGWTTDRYEPAAFENVGTYEGRDNVLGITIDSTTAQSTRPVGQQGLFYATQGRKFVFPVPKGPGSVLAADLYIPATWADDSNGTVRTDMWGTMIDSANLISAYPIIGFTNYGGVPRLRVWDDNGWNDLATPVTYDAWTSFRIELLADSSINCYVNGALVHTGYFGDPSVAFKEVIMQAYNFDQPVTLGTDPEIVGAVIEPYTAHWANTPVPAQSDFTFSPSSPIFDSNHVLVVAGDSAPGYPVASFASDGVDKTDMYFTPEYLFGRPVLLGQVESISYWTKKGTSHPADARDWYLTLYTKPFGGDVSTPTWYGARFGTEPYFSMNLIETAGAWNQWTTQSGNNQLRFFESTAGAPGASFGSYTDPTWNSFVGSNSLGTSVSRASQEILSFSVQTGSAWAVGFTGQVDGVRIQLNDGSVATINFDDDEAPLAMDTAVTPGAVPYTYAGNIDVTALIDDTYTGGSNIVSAEFSVGGGTWTPMAASDSAFDSSSEGVTGSFTLASAGISAPGVYSVCVRGYDAAGNVSNVDCTLLAVYDPNAGFVTGGGWINSPAGAYAADVNLAGKANFGFVSKYKKGASVPDGSTEFVFQAGGLNFHSSSYQWLVVNQSGQNAQFKGDGQINGAGDYGFMIWATDGAKGGTPDTFRIQIWDKDNSDAVVYDNGTDQAIGGGNILVQTGKK